MKIIIKNPVEDYKIAKDLLEISQRVQDILNVDLPFVKYHIEMTRDD